VNFSGDVLSRSVLDILLPHPAEVLNILERDIRGMTALLSADERLRLTGVGIAQPFHLGSWARELGLSAERFRAWDETDFPAELGNLLSLPVFSENDGNAAAIAELFYGCGRQCDDFVYVFLGSAVGGGIAIDGDCLRGGSGNAGDIGIMPVPPSRLASAPRPSGQWDILLSRASLNSLARHLRYSGESIENRFDINACIQRKLPSVEEWIDDCVEALAPALHATLCVVDVSTVVLDADVDNGLLDTLLERLQAAMTATVPEARSVPALVRGTFGSDAGAIGAATLPMFFNFSPSAGLLQSASVKPREVNHAHV
jgi:predicted NBD/HSP70 family sugar kinase